MALCRCGRPAVLGLLAGPALSGCGGEGTEEGTGGETLLVDYIALEDDAAWTWRDDGSSEDPEESELLRGRLTEEDTVVLVRGSRWADGSFAGELIFDTRYGLSLDTFDLGGMEGAGDWPMADFDPVTGETQASGAWSCSSTVGLEVETFYAIHEDTLTLDCASSDGEGLPGSWVFAEGIGLVRYEHPEGYTLDLVAPY